LIASGICAVLRCPAATPRRSIRCRPRLAFLAQVEGLPDLAAPPFCFPKRYQQSVDLVQKNVRTFPTTSIGRLFDSAAALLGFTREVTFEGQAAMWLEQLARGVPDATEPYPFPWSNAGTGFSTLLQAVVHDRLRGRPLPEIARAFQRGLAQGLRDAVVSVCASPIDLQVVVLSGGVFQNELLLKDLKSLFHAAGLEVWTNHAVPPNDGGISLGQAAMAAFARLRLKLGKPSARRREICMNFPSR
jgi:hydrogenase maturation protein HypF